MIPQSVIIAAQSAMKGWRIPASVSIAQWALESGWGSHSPGNNPFGIKAIKGLPAQLLTTTECKGKVCIKVKQSFAVFGSIQEAFEFHAKLLSTGKPYAQAMLALPDEDKFIHLMASKYATDPLYYSKIQAIISSHNLKEYDNVGSNV